MDITYTFIYTLYAACMYDVQYMYMYMKIHVAYMYKSCNSLNEVLINYYTVQRHIY